MKEYLKMADVFCGAANADADLLFDDDISNIADFSGYKKHCRYAAHAITEHDSLVAEVERLTRENALLKESLKNRDFEISGLEDSYSDLQNEWTDFDDFNQSMPMQPIVFVDGVARFKKNRIVDALLDKCSSVGFGLNEIALGEYSNDEHMQLAQLIGYSVSGYGSLSYVSDESYSIASDRVERILHKEKQDAKTNR